jgi:hypothetical protein
MRTSELNVFFSPEDIDLSAKSWRISSWGYVRRTINRKPDKPITVLAHREVMSRVLGRALSPDELVDHRDRNKRNNRRDNLRIVTASLNGMNRGIPSNNSSGHKGICRKGKGWQWQFRIRGIYFGGYDESLRVALRELRSAQLREGYEVKP